MLDTIRLVSPPISSVAMKAMEDLSVHCLAFDAVSGQELWHITRVELAGSFDHRVMVRLQGDSLVVEGSVHKALLGHNIFGGSDDVLACASFLVSRIQDLLGVILPFAGDWSVYKVDWAEAYYLNSYEAVEGYFRALQGVSYPRRKVSRYGLQSIHVPGRMTTLKLYHKGVEFICNDRKRLKKRLMRYDLDYLQSYADKILRSEVSIRRRLLEDFGQWPLVSQLTDKYLRCVHDSEMARLVREGRAEMRTVRTYLEVKARLFDMYSERTARVLLGTWVQLSAVGEEETRKGMKRATYFFHRKQLLSADCSWHSSDISQCARVFPADFVPLSSSPYVISGEHPEVKKKLDLFRIAS